MKISKIPFTKYLGIFSIMGFLTILMDSLTTIDIGPYVDAMLFLLIGFALFVAGGYNLVFGYFKNGLTMTEVNKIVSVVVGGISMVVGILILPFIGLEVSVLVGTKVIISSIAILVIIGELTLSNTCRC